MENKSGIQIISNNEHSLSFNLLEDEDIEQAKIINDAMQTYKERYLKKGIDFDVIPGCGNKPSLLKAGAEKLVRLFKLRPNFEIIDRIVDYQNNLFHYHYRCSLYRFDVMVGQCDGIASSKESKFSKPQLTCPTCGNTEAVRKDKNSNTYYCWGKLGGCGAKGMIADDVGGGETFNYNSLNTLCKMAIKRSLVGAVLIVCGASMYFSQDLDD